LGLFITCMPNPSYVYDMFPREPRAYMSKLAAGKKDITGFLWEMMGVA
jgi:hypothetical protein